MEGTRFIQMGQKAVKPISFLSFDVEALPGRAEKDHVDRLIWGKVAGQEYGIRKICSLLRDYKIKGNFLIDIAACALYGDRPIIEVGKYILSEGHELHVHLHSEWLIRSWGIKGSFAGAPGLNQFAQEINQSCMKHAYFKYRQLFGSVPEVFRSGGFMFNEHTITAGRYAGFRCLSNFNTQRHAEMLSVGENNAHNEPFSWGGGLVELPVDFSPEPLTFDISTYLNWFARVLDRKKIKTFNLTMHSWSLLKRDGDLFTEVAPEHEDRLRYICEHLCANTQVSGYSEYLAGAALPPVSINYFHCKVAVLESTTQTTTCTICGARFVVGKTDICPGCGARARHRQIVDALDRTGNPFNGIRVLACFANSVERLSILAGAKEIVNFDVRPMDEADFQMDIQRMDVIPDKSFDGFLAIHVLNHVKDDSVALSEIHRILRTGGFALITVPYRNGEKTTELSNMFEHYGIENYENYGVGSYRRYGEADAIHLFQEYFTVRKLEGYDSVTDQKMAVFLLIKN